MSRYTFLTYRKYGHLLKEFFVNLKSIFKNETYGGLYQIYMLTEFKRDHPLVEIPHTAVAVLWASFLYDTIDGKQTLTRYCFLDASGYRVPDNSVRQFNDCVDAWLERVYALHETASKKN
jgi:hypothetical protein